MTVKVRRMLLKTLRAVEAEVMKDADTKMPAAKSRAGKRVVAGHFDPAVSWQLKKLALDRSTSVQKLLEESIGDLFEKYHLPRA